MADKTLARLIDKVGPCALRSQWHRGAREHGPFIALVEAVAYQQLTAKAAATIFGRVKALFQNRPFPLPADIAGIPEETLRGAGLSGSKVSAVKDLAAKAITGVVPTAKAIRRLTDQEIIERLTGIRGIGQWTVEMLLIFRLGRPDILPATDYGIRKGFALTFRRKELPRPAEILERGERWRPYRTVASWYLWRALDLQKRP